MHWCIHSILKQDGVEKEADKQMIARRRSNLALAYKDTLDNTIIFPLQLPTQAGACDQRTRYVGPLSFKLSFFQKHDGMNTGICQYAPAHI